MKIYTKIVIDMATGETLEEESFEYCGEVAQCNGGGGGTTTNTVDKEYNKRMAKIAEEQQRWAGEYMDVWREHTKPYEIAQAQANLSLLPKETELYTSQLDAAQRLLPQQTAASENFLGAAARGVDINERMALASADVSSAWKNVNESTARQNARIGVNPNSGRFQGISAALGTQQAAALAGAKTQARVGGEQENFQRLAAAAQLNPSNSVLQGLGAMKG